MNYSVRRDKSGKVVAILSDTGFIPLDPRNKDYQEFLEVNKTLGLDLSDKAPDAPTPEETAINTDRATLRAIKQKLRSSPQTPLSTQDKADALQAIIGLLGG